MTHDLNQPAGFTLIEILVTLLISGIIGVAVTTTLFSLFKGASKTEIIKEVKQNGDYAMSVMEVKVRNAADIVSPCIGSPQTSLIIENPNASQTTFSCATNVTTRITQVDPPTTNYLTNTSVTLPTCTTANLSFTCTESTSRLKTVQISFTLRQANSSAPITEQASETFQTQVSLRNK